MQSWQMAATGVAIAIVIIALSAAWWIHRRNRTKDLRQRFGPEYDRRIAALGSRSRAERELAGSQLRVEKSRFHSLNPSDRMMFLYSWRLCQSQFVDDPAGALDAADSIVTNLMRMRGYAVDSPDDRQADVCAAYPKLAAPYREANEIRLRHKQGIASTRELRTAFVNLRSLFDELVGEPEVEQKQAS